MSFELRVEFAGLCLYMIDPGAEGVEGLAKKIAILMPDARKTADPIHPDGEQGEPHIGYVRFDLANLNTGIELRSPTLGSVRMGQKPLVEPGEVEDDAGDPPNEIIHRFDREELDFGLNDVSSVGHKLGIPSFNAFSDSLDKIAGLFDPDPPRELLMRTTLNGGSIRATGSGKIWKFSSALKHAPSGGPYTDQFAGYSVWTRQVEADDLTVTIKKFDGSVVAKIPLKPVPVKDQKGEVKDRITIKIANLCAFNPLEWREYRRRTVVNQDVDFKWLYRLLKPTVGTYETRLGDAKLPHPIEVHVQAFGDEDCVGGSITTPIP